MFPRVYGQLGDILIPRRYVAPGYGGRFARRVGPYHLGALEDGESDPFVPDIPPEDEAQACLAVGGVWDNVNRECDFDYEGIDPENAAAYATCVYNGGVWNEPERRCEGGTGGRELPPGFVAPGPTKIHISSWDTSAEPYARYQLAWGDTYVGLAKTYLDPSGVRWREIWDLNRAQHPDPSAIYVGQVINMPAEARDNFKRWLARRPPGQIPPGGVEPGDEPTLPSETPKGSGKGWLIAAAGAAVLGGGLYFMS